MEKDGPKIDSDIIAIKAARAAELESIWSALGPGSFAMGMCARAARATDRAVSACWDSARMPEGCAAIAVGGYGRDALWPGSDVDVMVLAPSAAEVHEDILEEAVGRFAAAMWDAGLDPGLVSRRIDECESLARSDVTIRCAMMERRWVVGSKKVFEDLGYLMEKLDPLDFYLAKMREQRDRHERHGDSPFILEPNLKESPGGLRDLQMPMWVARSMGIEPTWEGLRVAGLLTGGEAELASACEARLSLLRAMLHRQMARRDERLTFEAQSKLAESLGIGMEDGKSAAAMMMDGYFACARSVVMINEVLLQSMGERLLDARSGPKRRLSDRFYEQGGYLWANEDEVFAREPGALFEAFALMQSQPSLEAMGSSSTRALWRASRRVDSWFRSDDANRRAFVSMLRSPSGVVSELNRMARVGLLGAYIPAFGKAETLMQHDLFHAYTVGRHTLGVVRGLRRFQREDRAHELPVLSEIAAGFKDYWLLYVGALFHDIAKGRGGSHEEKGEVDARLFCDQHGIDGEDKDLIAFLVRRHLDMSRVSQKEDIQDPDVVEAFAKMCGSARRLDALYLLTVADMRATGPTVWNGWKASLLESLWRQSSRVLSGDWQGGSGKVARMRNLAFDAGRSAGADEHGARSYVESLDDLYYLRVNELDCAWHARALAPLDRRETSCFVELGSDRVAKVAMWSADREGLFVKICSALARAGLSVRSAKLASSKSGWALDSFDAEDVREPSDLADRKDEIERMLLAALAPGAREEKPAMGRCSARARHSGAIAQAHISKAGADWLVEVACADRAGVLWSIAEELAKRGLAVKSARVSTVGERAEDVFVVEGAVLESADERLALESALVERLGL